MNKIHFLILDPRNSDTTKIEIIWKKFLMKAVSSNLIRIMQYNDRNSRYLIRN